jgi:lipoate---protein ligase
MWKVFDTGVKTAEENMRLDTELLENLSPQGEAVLHLYDWKGPSATYGYFIKTKDFLNLEVAKSKGLSLAKRPTGGGIVFHLSDLAFSVLLPAGHEGFSENTLDNYHYVNERVILAVKGVMQEASLELLPEDPKPLDKSSSNFCMAKPTIFDVMIEGKKVAGAAQRKRKQGFLHQGSISIALPDTTFLNEILLPGTKVLEAMKANSYTMLKSPWSPKDLEEVRHMLKKHLKRIFLEG